jgi:hypothetical protein
MPSLLLTIVVEQAESILKVLITSPDITLLTDGAAVDDPSLTAHAESPGETEVASTSFAMREARVDLGFRFSSG